MVVREKTRLCSVDWKNEAIEWSNLGVGDFIGTQDLISEDDKTELNLKGCGKALDDMWVIIKNRGWSWRQFCGYRSLPLSLRQSNHSKSNKKQISTEKVLSETSPIKVLFWIASTLGGIHQVKVLRMIAPLLASLAGLYITCDLSLLCGGNISVTLFRPFTQHTSELSAALSGLTLLLHVCTT